MNKTAILKYTASVFGVMLGMVAAEVFMQNYAKTEAK